MVRFREQELVVALSFRVSKDFPGPEPEPAVVGLCIERAVIQTLMECTDAGRVFCEYYIPLSMLRTALIALSSTASSLRSVVSIRTQFSKPHLP